MSKASEHQHQKTFVRWFRVAYPNIVIFSTPNGGTRTPQEAKKLKDEGMLKGVCDLFIPELKLFIEMKKIGGVVSKEQRAFMGNMRDCGYNCVVAYSYIEAKEYIEEVMCGS